MKTPGFSSKIWLISGLVAALIVLGLTPRFRDSDRHGGGAAWAGDSSDSNSDFLIPNTFAEMAEKALPSVVSIYVKRRAPGRRRPPITDPQLRRFFELPESEEGEEDPHDELDDYRTSGSGVILSADGYIVTNNHIVQGASADTISITLYDDTEIEAGNVEIKATDPYLDLALLKIDGEGLDLRPLAWGDSDKLRIGDWVMAIGNPLNLSGSVSKGIVSGKSRKINKVPIENLIQTDAMINPGNSGGALINLKGELVGINMAIATNSGYFQGIGFAIPSNDAQFVAESVMKYGRIRRGYIGIRMEENPDLGTLRALGLEPDDEGILVVEVMPKTPAALAGVMPYDYIVKVDEGDVASIGDLLGRIATKRVGETVSLTIKRGNDEGVEETRLEMDVMERPTDDELQDEMRSAPMRREKPKEDDDDGIGLVLEEPENDDFEGLEIVEVRRGSPAEKAGLKEGDILLEIDRQPTATLKDYEEAISGESKRPFLIRYFSQETNRVTIGSLPRPRRA